MPLNSKEISSSLAIGGVIGLAGVGSTVLYLHRELTHKSLVNKPLTKHLCQVMTFFMGIDPQEWVPTHLIHHQFRDANLGPILETADALEYLDTHPEVDYNIPKKFKGLDPYVELSPDQVKIIGNLLRPSLVDKYQPASEYSQADLAAILDSDTIKYLYPSRKTFLRRQVAKLIKPIDNQDYKIKNESLRAFELELRDPHSPSLDELGPIGILISNPVDYHLVAKYFKKQRQTQVEHNKQPQTEIPAVVGILLLDSLISLGHVIYRRPKNIQEIISTLKLSAIMASTVHGEYIFGGNATNSFGHCSNSVIQGFSNKMTPDSQGLLASNRQSFILNILGFDEPNRQLNHHLNPEQVAYSSAKNLKTRLEEAPFGLVIDYLASIGVFFSLPKSVTTANNKLRFDQAHPAVKKLEDYRVAL